jgi:hypothetical protein
LLAEGSRIGSSLFLLMTTFSFSASSDKNPLVADDNSFGDDGFLRDYNFHERLHCLPPLMLAFPVLLRTVSSAPLSNS